ncbi:MAG TPA: aldehyde dehydrogenase family protein [Myxococcota bacterium]|nr:aldehyde dehydrogenase family protein [Myxococcota bacterium]
MRSVNPWTGEVLARHAAHSAGEVERRLQLCAKSQTANQGRSIAARGAPLLRLGELLEERAEALGALATAEMGKPISEAIGEVNKCATVCRYYAQRAEELLAPAPTGAPEAHVRFDPLGVVLAVMPWNFPYWQVLRFGAPAWMAGNTMLIKHAPNTLGCAKALESLALEAGFPEGAMSLVIVDVDEVPALIRDPRVAAVTVTGSERAGSAVASVAGAALKKCVLELGGSDPFIVFADADLDAAVAGAVAARIQNNGQSCCAAKRFLVESRVASDFGQRLVAAFEALEVGDPSSASCRLGPLAREDLVETLGAQVEDSVAAGARLLCGGSRQRLVYAPTVLVDVREGMRVFDEETFGPVAAVTAFSDLEQALALSNASAYGLTASIWTADVPSALGLARRLEVGGVFLNRIPGSDPRFPFGGVKKSGYGRELGVEGIREFVNVKTVWVQ